MDINLRYELEARDRYKFGIPIVLGFTLKNLSQKTAWALTWYTPLEGIKGNIFVVKCDNVIVPYEGRMVKRANPTRDEYICLFPGKSVHVEFDLSSCYSLVECKKCFVKFTGQIHDIALDEKQFPKSLDEHQKIQIQGKDVSFSILRQ